MGAHTLLSLLATASVLGTNEDAVEARRLVESALTDLGRASSVRMTLSGRESYRDRRTGVRAVCYLSATPDGKPLLELRTWAGDAPQLTFVGDGTMLWYHNAPQGTYAVTEARTRKQQVETAFGLASSYATYPLALMRDALDHAGARTRTWQPLVIGHSLRSQPGAGGETWVLSRSVATEGVWASYRVEREEERTLLKTVRLRDEREIAGQMRLVEWEMSVVAPFPDPPAKFVFTPPAGARALPMPTK